MTGLEESDGRARGKGKEGGSKVRWWWRRLSGGNQDAAWSCRSNMVGYIIGGIPSNY